MAKTKQTAKKSTGGTAPRQELAARAARIPRRDPPAAPGTYRREGGQEVRYRPGEAVPARANEVNFDDKSHRGIRQNLFRWFGREDVQNIRRSSDHRGRFVVDFGRNRRDPCQVTARELEFLFGPQIVEFASDPAISILTAEMACRLGLTESHGDTEKYAECPDDTDWIIEKIWLSKGGENGELEGCFYASAEGERTGHRIDLYTMVFHQVSEPAERDAELQEQDNPSPVTRGSGQPSRVSLIASLDAWCYKHPGKKKRVNVAMARVPSPEAPDFFVGTPRNRLVVPVQDFTNNCLRAAAANGIALVCDFDTADRFFRRELARDEEERLIRGYCTSVLDFGSVSKAIADRDPSTVTLPRVAIPFFDLGAPDSRSRQWVWLREKLSREPDVYVVRVWSRDGLKHAISIDSRTKPGLIYDSSEAFVMSLESRAFFLGCSTSKSSDLSAFDDLRRVRREGSNTEEKRAKRQRMRKREKVRKAKTDGAGPS